MIENKNVISSFCFLSMLFLGVGSTLIGAAARNIGLTPFQIGLILSIQNFGFMLAVTVSGALADTYEKPKILFVGSIILAASFLTFYVTDSFFLNLVIMFFIGIGIGSYEGVTDAMLLEMQKGRESIYININHFFVTFGALVITAYLLFLQMNWRKSVTQAAVGVLILAILLAFTRQSSEGTVVEKLSERLRFLRKQKTVLLLFLATICAIGLELCLTGIITTFLMELRGFSQVTSKLGLITFLTGIAAGRLSIGFFVEKARILHLIMLLFALSAVSIGGVLFFDAMELTYTLLFISGGTISAILPLIITLTGIMYKDMSGTVMGIIKLAIPVGGISIPFFLSVISRYASLEFSLLLFPSIALVGFLILFLSRKAFQSNLEHFCARD